MNQREIRRRLNSARRCLKAEHVVNFKKPYFVPSRRALVASNGMLALIIEADGAVGLFNITWPRSIYTSEGK